MVMSVYQQRIKRHGVRETAAHFMERFLNKRFDNRLWVDQWAEVFGKENLRVRPYEQQQFAGGDIFSDFLCQLGLEMTEEFIRPSKKINASYRIDALEAMRLLNCLPLEQHQQELDAVLQHYSDQRGKDGDWPYPLLSPSQRLELCRQYQDSNAAIAREYLNRPDGRLFYDPLPDMAEAWQPYPGLSPDDVRTIAEFIALEAPAVSLKIADTVKSRLGSGDPQIQQAAEILSYGLERLAKADTASVVPIQRQNRWTEISRAFYYRLPVRLREPLKYCLRSVYRKIKMIFGS
jgi:hypothetical protein